METETIKEAAMNNKCLKNRRMRRSGVPQKQTKGPDQAKRSFNASKKSKMKCGVGGCSNHIQLSLSCHLHAQQIFVISGFMFYCLQTKLFGNYFPTCWTLNLLMPTSHSALQFSHSLTKNVQQCSL